MTYTNLMAALTFVLALPLHADAPVCPATPAVRSVPVAPKAHEGIKHLTTMGEFQKEVLDSETPVIVKFFATWCPPCKRIQPEIDKLSKELAGKVKVVAVDVDKGAAIAAAQGVMSMPTIIFYKKGITPAREMGYKSFNALRSLATKHFGV